MRLFLLLKLAYATSLLASCVYVGRHGGAAERAGIAVITIGSLLTIPASTMFGFRWDAARLNLLALDVLVLGAFLLIALRSGRFWPLWATGFQLIAVATHLAMLIEPRRVLQAYAIAQGFWAYPMLAAIVLATTRLRQARRTRTTPS